MKKIFTIVVFLLSSCEFFDSETQDNGMCVFYELTVINNTPIDNYDCWNNIEKTECGGTWYLDQSCEEFCEEKLTEEYTLCNVY